MVEDSRHLELGERLDWRQRQGPNCLFTPNFLGTLEISGALEVSWAPTCHPTFTLPCPTYSLSNFPWSNTSDQIKADKSRKFKDQIKSWLALIRAGYHLIWKTKNGSLKKKVLTTDHPGDEVLSINGQVLQGMTHGQVIMSSSAWLDSGHLCLVSWSPDPYYSCVGGKLRSDHHKVVLHRGHMTNLQILTSSLGKIPNAMIVAYIQSFWFRSS